MKRLILPQREHFRIVIMLLNYHILDALSLLQYKKDVCSVDSFFLGLLMNRNIHGTTLINLDKLGNWIPIVLVQEQL